MLLQAEAIRKSFAGVHALRGVSFALRAGEVHALVGENGAGKSTLVKIIAGAETPDSGSLRIADRPVAHHTPAQARALGVAMVYQQPSLFPHLTVAENIALAIESRRPFHVIRWNRMVERARDLLAHAGTTIDPRRLVSSLSMPEQQLVEIAKALGMRARTFILDEPTASLGANEVESLFAVLAGLRKEGAGIVYVSHRLEEILRIADRVTVLRDGQTVATEDAAGLSRESLIRLMVGREISAIFPKRPVTIGNVVLETRHLSNSAARLRDVSLSVRAGEILGVAGLAGAGRTEFAETLFGITPADSGEILLRGQPVRLDSPSNAIRHGIAYLPEDRARHGVILPMPIAANTTLASLRAVSRRGLLDAAAERSVARGFVERLRIKTDSLYTPAGSLSGGNQQKVALARWLAIRPSVLILDEPTQGVDIGSKSEIHALMANLAEEGVAILMISSELPEILGMSDRIAVMRAGSLAGILSRDEATQECILSLALGHAYDGDAA
jgi:rhamnose transport system ATP-binding protein